jgi:hypothetical protein
MVLPPTSLPHLSVRAVPESLLFAPFVPAHRTRAARGGFKSGVSYRLELTIPLKWGRTKCGQVEFQVVGCIILFEQAMEFAVKPLSCCWDR